MRSEINEILRSIAINFRRLGIEGIGTVNDLSLDKNGDLHILFNNDNERIIKGVNKYLDDRSIKTFKGVTEDLYSRGILRGVFDIVKFLALMVLIAIVTVLIISWNTFSSLFRNFGRS